MCIFPIDASEFQLSWIMWDTIGMNYWAFGGTSISWNTTLFPFIIINISVSLKLNVNFKLKWFRLRNKNVSLDAGIGGMIYLNKLMLWTIMVMFISPQFVYSTWSINTEYTMEKGEALV